MTIGHDTTEVIELIPAEVIVRRDVREKLAFNDCEGELARAPTGDKVVAGGRLGTTLVAQVLVGRYVSRWTCATKARKGASDGSLK